MPDRRLDVGDGNHVWWESLGNPDGKPVLTVHGGPGSGHMEGLARMLDLEQWRVVNFDQRGCGESTPNAADPATDMSVNTTRHLISDMERLREETGVDRWLLYGGSWGSTLSLAYAEAHPEHVSEIVLVAITTSRKAESDWLYNGVGRFFPEQWERFADYAGDRADPVGAYARLMEDPDRTVRLNAAREWMRWEDAVLSAEPSGRADLYSDRPDDELITFVRICSHYFSNGAFLEDEQILRNADRLAGIPAVLIHGRLDLSSPLDTAWQLVKRWPDAELVVIDDAGHKGSDAMGAAVGAAFAHFAPSA